MKQRDLTEGSILKGLVLFFLPIAAGNLFQQFYNAADAVIVGKYVGTGALAAVGGSAANIFNVLISFFVSLASGAAVIVGHQFGAKNEKELQKSISTGLTFCFFVGIGITIFGIVTAKPLLSLLKTPAETIEDSARYLNIIYLGVTAQILYNMEASIMHAVGDSKSPFIYLFICCATNIALDIVFVKELNLGVEGVAIATALVQVLSLILGTVRLVRTKEMYRIDLKNLRIYKDVLKKMLRIGIPSAFQSSAFSVSCVIIQVAVNTLGTTIVAGWALSSRVDGFYWVLSGSAGTAVMNFTAQNFGANKMDRVKAGEKVALRVFLIMTAVVCAILLTLGRLALPLFTDDPNVVQATSTVMLWIIPFYIIWTFLEVINGLLRGVGDVMIPTIISCVGIALFRVIWIAVVFRFFPTLEVVTLSYGTSWILTVTALMIYYYSGKWQKNLEKRN